MLIPCGIIVKLPPGEEPMTADPRSSLSQFFRESPLAGLDLVRDRSPLRPAGALPSTEEYDGWMETLDILSDPELSRDVHTGLEEADQGRLVSHEEAWKGMDDPEPLD
jgi:hypothetical protein